MLSLLHVTTCNVVIDRNGHKLYFPKMQEAVDDIRKFNGDLYYNIMSFAHHIQDVLLF